MQLQLIDPAHFVTTMDRHWTETLGNVSSDALHAAWRQLAHHFGRHILAHGKPDQGTEWTVLQPATGSGKSQGTAVYCAMLAGFESNLKHPGVLIVTRLKADADGMASDINRLAGRPDYARAYHSDATGPGVLDSLRDFPVLVITHRAYELALDALGQDGTIRQTWPYFHGWRGLDERKLVIIDEALDIVEESRGELDGLRMTLAAIPQAVREDHPGAVSALKVVIELLEQMASRSSISGTVNGEAVLLREMIDQGTVPDVTALRLAMRKVRFDRQLYRNDDALQRSQWVIHDDRLRSLDMILRSWLYYARVPNQGHTLNTARLLVPEEVKGAVVLDATATSNVVYELFERANRIEAPTGVRSYRNVTLHVSRGHKVGKVTMRREGAKVVAEVFRDLDGRIAGRSAFVVSHQATEGQVLAQTAAFQVKAGHWGAVTGSNEWRDCDVAVVVGVPYRPDTWTANTFMALQGVQTTQWLRKTNRPWGEHEDIRSALKLGQVVTDIVQAINRIRCRKVIDEQGNCPSADVFILLPDGPQGDAILAGIEQLMPGVRVSAWQLQSTTSTAGKRGRKAGSGGTAKLIEAAVAHLLAALPGRISKADLTHALGLEKKAWERVVAALRDTTTQAGAALAAKGITLQVQGSGRGSRSFFVKPF